MISSFQRLASLFVSHTIHPDAQVHFHQGPQGEPAVCHDSNCAVPRLSV